MSYPKRDFSRAQLLDRISVEHVNVQEQTVNVHNLRLGKIFRTENASFSDLIQTVRGIGCRFSPSDLDGVRVVDKRFHSK